MDDEGRTEEEASDIATTDDEDDPADKRKTGAHAASVDNSADVEYHDLHSEPVDDTTQHNRPQ